MQCIRSDVTKKQDALRRIRDRVAEVSSGFTRLEFFKGRFLKQIYEHQAEIDEEYRQESNAFSKNYKNAPPLFAAHEVRK